LWSGRGAILYWGELGQRAEWWQRWGRGWGARERWQEWRAGGVGGRSRRSRETGELELWKGMDSSLLVL
jgi:hypothetical protein